MRIHPIAAAMLVASAATLHAASDKRFFADRRGYLPSAFDVRPAIPPAPRAGDARDEADRRIFRETRGLIGTPRYRLATADVEIGPAALGRDFACAAGVALTREAAPRTFAMLDLATVDTGRANSDAKDYYRRARPYLVDRGAVCQPPGQLAGSYDYPSGHATYGWTWGYVLADLLPDRAGAILQRARAYGDSRYICGVHSFSAVAAAQGGAAATMAVVRETPAYRADAKRARRELARLTADPKALRPAGCETERALTADPSP